MDNLEILRKLCSEYWNPIGIPMLDSEINSSSGMRPLPVDEYDTYLLHAANLISSHASLEAVVEYLQTVESEYLMLSEPAGDKHKFASALMEALRKL